MVVTLATTEHHEVILGIDPRPLGGLKDMYFIIRTQRFLCLDFFYALVDDWTIDEDALPK